MHIGRLPRSGGTPPHSSGPRRLFSGRSAIGSRSSSVTAASRTVHRAAMTAYHGRAVMPQRAPVLPPTQRSRHCDSGRCKPNALRPWRSSVQRRRTTLFHCNRHQLGDATAAEPAGGSDAPWPLAPLLASLSCGAIALALTLSPPAARADDSLCSRLDAPAQSVRTPGSARPWAAKQIYYPVRTQPNTKPCNHCNALSCPHRRGRRCIPRRRSGYLESGT